MPLLISLAFVSFLNVLLLVSLKFLPSVFFSYQRTTHLTLRDDVVNSVARTVGNAYNLRQQTESHRDALNDADPSLGGGLQDCFLRDVGPPEQDLKQGNPIQTPNGVGLCMPEDLVLQGQRYCESYDPPFQFMSYCYSFQTDENIFAGLDFKRPGFSILPRALAQTLYFEAARPAAPVLEGGPILIDQFDTSAARAGMDPGDPPMNCDEPRVDCVSVLICLRGQNCVPGRRDLVLITLLFYP